MTHTNEVIQSIRARKLGNAAKTAFSTLATLAARGREDAAVELYKVATSATTALTRLCQNKPELFTAIAEKKMTWPVMWGAHRDTVEENKKLIDELKLASGTGIDFSWKGKRFIWNHPANQIAIYVHEIAQVLQRAPVGKWDVADDVLVGSIGWSSSPSLTGDYRRLSDLEEWGQRGAGRMLPTLSEGTAEKWAKATPELFRLLFGKNFESHPKLQQLREHVKFRTTYGEGKTGGAGILGQEMLRAVKQAWRSIAMD